MILVHAHKENRVEKSKRRAGKDHVAIFLKQVCGKKLRITYFFAGAAMALVLSGAVPKV